MRISIQSWFMACCMLLLGSVSALAQPGDCDPASLPGDPGSCQAPNTTFPNGGPDCYVCVTDDDGIGFECVPSDAFCDGISGGKASNECRAAECIPGATGLNPANPSGCDYTLDPGADENCVLCISPDPVPFNHCGNGICEPLEGESCASCAIDCNPAGYPGTCLDQAGADAICLDPVPIKFITFPGPPYATSGQFPDDACEDGDLCTDNVCGGGQLFPNAPSGSCVIVDKVCNPVADFCCPIGCTESNDPDCYVPEECGVPTPTPIPIPTPTPPPPPFNRLLEGSGCSLGALAGAPSALAWIAGLGLLAAAGFGKRRR